MIVIYVVHVCVHIREGPVRLLSSANNKKFTYLVLILYVNDITYTSNEHDSFLFGDDNTI